MKRKRIKYTAELLLTAFMMTGCGTKLYEMTDEEQQLVAEYSAYALAKYNVYQKDGMTAAKEEETSNDKQTETETESEAQTAKASNAAEKLTSDTQTTESISLAEAIGYENLSVTYAGGTKTDTYKEGSYYSMEAGTKKSYAVMKFTISNSTAAAVDVDLFTNAKTYTARFLDGKDYQAEGSFLTYSLTTYQDTLKPQESVDVVLLFKIPQDTACDDVSLSVTKDNIKYQIEL